MARFLTLRLIQTVIALIGISILIFVLVRASGDPTLLMISSVTSVEDQAGIRENRGLDKSIPEQYWIFVKDVAQGDLGESLHKKTPVTEMIAQRLPVSLKLTISSFIISMLAALALGILGATRRDSLWDNGGKFLAILGPARPGFWVAIMAIYIFAVHWQILPAYGSDTLAHYILPVATMSFFMLPGMMRLVRSSMLDVLDSEYIKLARIKGLPERTIIWKHALRNALISPLTAAGMIFAGLITGAVIIEVVFTFPGIGRLLVDAVIGRDFPIVQSITIMVAVVVLGINLLVDILYAYIDPQIRYQRT